MKKLCLFAPLLVAAAPAPEPPKPVPSPGEIVAAAPAADWVAIPPGDLLVMELAGIPDKKVLKRRLVYIQLMPPPFSQGWVGNIRKLAAARWWDGTSVNRVQDNYVVQWGDATEKKALPAGLATVPESEYIAAIMEKPIDDPIVHGHTIRPWATNVSGEGRWSVPIAVQPAPRKRKRDNIPSPMQYRNETYGYPTGFAEGWPVSGELNARGFGKTGEIWPVHCYGMVGVGRGMSPDTGSGAELYTVIGHAPRHLDRNIALVGRVIEGIEHLSSLPRGTGPLGFYEKEEERVPIVSIRLADSIKEEPVPRFEYLSTESPSFARYADARANRRDPFFIKPAGGADICNIPVPARRAR